MKIVIIEDEPLTARDLAGYIRAARPDADIVAMLSSVREATDFFKAHPAPDVIFSDIQLGDGLSFSIFEAIQPTIPVIFCTAYDEYALDAFRAAGIDYILKPFTAKDIAAALAKYQSLRGTPPPAYQQLHGLFGNGKDPKQRSVLVFYKDKIMPVSIGDIALFYLKNEVVRLVTFGKQQHVVGKTLEEMERLTTGQFCRVNRQHLVNREAIRDVSQYFNRRLLVNLKIPFDEQITVGRVKMHSFLEWLAGA
jgi:two-component system, LytTR family, response regulator LytT